MADRTIIISSEPECHALPNPARGKQRDRFRWQAPVSGACIRFKKNDWPFSEDWHQHKEISIGGGDSQEFKVRDDAQGEYTYTFECQPCQADIAGGGSASIIID